MQVTLVHNPGAGQGNLGAEELKGLIAAGGHRVRYVSSKGDDFPAALTEAAELVVVAGGDGTVGKVIAGLPDRCVPLAILPAGTANNIARSLGIAGTPEQIVRGWRRGGTVRFDVGVADGPWGQRRFFEGVGGGALTEAMAAADGSPLPSDGEMKLARTAFRAVLGTTAPHPLRVDVDGTTLPGDLLLVEVSNIARLGPGLPLAHSADPGDGLLDVVLLPQERRDALLAWLDAAEPDAPAPVLVERGRCVRLRGPGAPLRIDDDFLPPLADEAVVTISLEAEPVLMLVPRLEQDGD